jgi:hypothetical protein
MACTTSKIPDATAVIKGMRRVFFHLSRYFSYSSVVNEYLKMNIQILKSHRYKCHWSTEPISTCLNDKLSRNRHGWVTRFKTESESYTRNTIYLVTYLYWG